MGSIPGQGIKILHGNSHPVQYSYQGNSMDRGTWRAPVHGATKSWTRLSKTRLYILGHISGGTSGKEPVCQCNRPKRPGFNPWVGKIPWRMKWQSTPALFTVKVPYTEEPGGLQSMELRRFGLVSSQQCCMACFKKKRERDRKKYRVFI